MSRAPIAWTTSICKPLYQSEGWGTTIQMKMSLIISKISFSYERIGIRFEKEAKGNSEMAYWSISDTWS